MNIEQKDKTLFIGGEITVGTLNADGYRRFQTACRAGIDTLDFAAVTRADSACVSLLLAALRAGIPHSAWRNVPPSVTALAQLYEIQELL